MVICESEGWVGGPCQPGQQSDHLPKSCTQQRLPRLRAGNPGSRPVHPGWPTSLSSNSCEVRFHQPCLLAVSGATPAPVVGRGARWCLSSGMDMHVHPPPISSSPACGCPIHPDTTLGSDQPLEQQARGHLQRSHGDVPSSPMASWGVHPSPPNTRSDKQQTSPMTPVKTPRGQLRAPAAWTLMPKMSQPAQCTPAFGSRGAPQAAGWGMNGNYS